jgi:hypothetical protein
VWQVPAIVTVVLLLTSVVAPSAFIFAEPGGNSDHAPKRFVVVLKDAEHPSELAKSHQVEKLRQYGHALNGLAVSASSSQIEKIRNLISISSNRH